MPQALEELHPADIAAAMERALTETGVKIYKGMHISRLAAEDNSAGDGEEYRSPISFRCGNTVHTCDALILATGGVSYPGTGSTGDGHRMLSGMDIPVTDLRPSLVPIETKEKTVELMGLTLKNVSLTAYRGEKEVFSEQGEMLFDRSCRQERPGRDPYP